MMDNKLSELSKPVMYVVRTLDGSVASVKSHSYTAPKGFTSEPLYSQEYVSALLAELERYKQYAKERDAENESLALTVGRLRTELEAKDKRITTVTEEREFWRERVDGAEKEREEFRRRFNLERSCLEDADKRIAELEAELSEMTTFRDNAVKKNERRWGELLELRAKLATPVRLPGSFYPDGDIECPLVVELDEVIGSIRAAGFTVERNEQ